MHLAFKITNILKCDLPQFIFTNPERAMHACTASLQTADKKETVWKAKFRGHVIILNSELLPKCFWERSKEVKIDLY